MHRMVNPCHISLYTLPLFSSLLGCGDGVVVVVVAVVVVVTAAAGGDVDEEDDDGDDDMNTAVSPSMGMTTHNKTKAGT